MPSAYAKTKTQFLYKHTNRQYYARGYAQGKSVWRSLKTDLYSAAVARLKPALDEIRLQPNPATASAATLGDLIGLYLAQVSRRVGIKPSTVHYRKQLFGSNPERVAGGRRPRSAQSIGQAGRGIRCGVSQRTFPDPVQ